MPDATPTARRSGRKRRPGAPRDGRKKRRPGLVAFLQAAFVAVVGPLVTYYGFCTLCLVLYNVVPPPVTGVQLQRRVESFFEDEPYARRYRPVGAARLSPHLRHAVVAAEDGRFYEHSGVDWEAVQKAIQDNQRRGRVWRGGSTITQQLVKNLFMTTHSSFVRKALEIPLTYLAELLLPKERILVLYLNVIEWGRGIYGAEAAARHYYGKPAADVTRYQAAALAAVIPSPRRRTPQRMGGYASAILRRMHQHGW